MTDAPQFSPSPKRTANGNPRTQSAPMSGESARSEAGQAGPDSSGLAMDLATEEARSDPSIVPDGEAKQMLDVRMPHVHAPHGEVQSWRSFFTHIAIVAIGLLLALGLEQGVEYIHHEFQRARLEEQMHQTFESNLRRADRSIKTLENFRDYLIELRAAVSSRIAGGSKVPPKVSDPRNFAYVPPPNLGPYEASKLDGSVSLLSFNRIQILNRIEFQHGLMQNNFQHFFESLADLRGFADRFPSASDMRTRGIPQPDINSLSAAQLIEYQVVIGKAIQNSRAYAQQLENLKLSYQLTLEGLDDPDVLTDSLIKVRRVN